ncbi:Uncharacterised protein [Legionella lansingensis]|uniref:Uncharacterized protein n=1 Tax=Legionella lansingensis TaxID=45067 RepID=A0A0W0V756_9GAMM|nr:hypothetical protein [Legionella lansingensis]KTD15940.1 hypothetical protein Llan_2612 [Legionella lansingensis]SNV48078.1 Uncharacterised protein [Legionella lansingensis]
MRKHSIIIASFTLFLTQASFAGTFDTDDLSNKQCDAIADACRSAGYTDEGIGDKSFWFACMKPVLYGKTVNSVSIATKDVKECRKAKIAKLKKELKELQSIE